LEVRAVTEALCASLEIEDHMLQAMPDASPAKWHLAHVTWFFETFLLQPFHVRDGRPYTVFHPEFCYLFNSYYEAVGARQPRARRSMLSRPTLADVHAYRAHVDRCMVELLDAGSSDEDEVARRTLLGLHHEQQHQELLATDIKYNLGTQPLRPAWRPVEAAPVADAVPLAWVPFSGGQVEIGHDGHGFCFDNELPRHVVIVPRFELASRLVSNAEYLAFMEAGGYRDPSLWLADGWAWVQAESVTHPLYWREREGDWESYTLHGVRPLAPHEPVCHVSAYEADAYARWAGARLPTEFEWEHAASSVCDTFTVSEDAECDMLDMRWLHPRGARGEGLTQMNGVAWSWTRSAYLPYPGYRTLPGALGEYNGKFMSSQWVLRGGSCATPRGHLRLTYRNFFYPSQRWQFTGIRLAKNAP
jgi:ergothioneine biosynthesis protein EgtB